MNSIKKSNMIKAQEFRKAHKKAFTFFLSAQSFVFQVSFLNSKFFLFTNALFYQLNVTLFSYFGIWASLQ